jgi:hypothetical protein
MATLMKLMLTQHPTGGAEIVTAEIPCGQMAAHMGFQTKFEILYRVQVGFVPG